MNHFTWLPEYSVGDELLDQQHRMLFDLVEKVRAFQGDPDKAVSDRQLADLVDETVRYARTHFHAEEFVMRKMHFQGIDAHIHEHRQFLKELEGIVAAMNVGELTPLSLFKFLSAWIKQHVAISDMKYKKARQLTQAIG